MQPSESMVETTTMRRTPGFMDPHFLQYRCRSTNMDVYNFVVLLLLVQDLDIEINQVMLEGGSIQDLHNLLKAWFNLLPYYEVGIMTTIYLEIVFGMPYVFMTPMGVVHIAECI